MLLVQAHYEVRWEDLLWGSKPGQQASEAYGGITAQNSWGQWQAQGSYMIEKTAF